MRVPAPGDYCISQRDSSRSPSRDTMIRAGRVRARIRWTTIEELRSELSSFVQHSEGAE